MIIDIPPAVPHSQVVRYEVAQELMNAAIGHLNARIHELGEGAADGDINQLRGLARSVANEKMNLDLLDGSAIETAIGHWTAWLETRDR